MSAPAPPKKNDQTAVSSTGSGTTEFSTRARVGDEIVVRGITARVGPRDGEIVGLPHPDGSPPYGVRRAVLPGSRRPHPPSGDRSRP
ncbi:DUF1918 domain-containing protein [Streptomyces sp. AF1A]|uniref:DUF1918 domain-containing protein n=1 Tax=Streptomyces sp. AF1A TaxID=3394350 RepID=UPI0039BD7605